MIADSWGRGETAKGFMVLAKCENQASVWDPLMHWWRQVNDLPIDVECCSFNHE